MNAASQFKAGKPIMQSSESNATDGLEAETLKAFETLRTFARSVLMVACFSGLLAFVGAFAQGMSGALA